MGFNGMLQATQRSMSSKITDDDDGGWGHHLSLLLNMQVT